MAETTSDFVSEEEIDNARTEAGKTHNTVIVIKTLTMKSIGAVPERCIIAKDAVLMARFKGIMFGTERQSLAADADKPDKDKTWFTAIAGDCTADVYLDDGAMLRYAGGFCYMPGGFQERELAKFQRLTPEQQQAGMEFDVQIAARPVDNPRGFGYMGRSMILVSAREQMLINRIRQADRADGEALLLAAARGKPLLIEDQDLLR